ncbi:MAG: hypothetical protein QXY45_03720 [Candidatus Aenigmatarchaeota archaeon]
MRMGEFGPEDRMLNYLKGLYQNGNKPPSYQDLQEYVREILLAFCDWNEGETRRLYEQITQNWRR